MKWCNDKMFYECMLNDDDVLDLKRRVEKEEIKKEKKKKKKNYKLHLTVLATLWITLLNLIEFSD